MMVMYSKNVMDSFLKTDTFITCIEIKYVK